MADKKISALTAATLPLAGTEVLPIVQSGSTVKVATDDLTVKNIRSNATSGLLQVAGPGAGTTRVMTTPNANFTAARTDAAQSFTGDQTLSTGNLIQGTAAKGVNFTANTPAAGMTSQLLNWYEEGTWTPVIGGSSGTSGQSYTTQAGFYTRIGNTVIANFQVQLSAKGTISGNAQIQDLPFTSVSTSTYRTGGYITYFANLGSSVVQISLLMGNSSTSASIEYLSAAAASSSDATTTQISDTTRLDGVIIYRV